MSCANALLPTVKSNDMLESVNLKCDVDQACSATARLDISGSQEAHTIGRTLSA